MPTLPGIYSPSKFKVPSFSWKWLTGFCKSASRASMSLRSCYDSIKWSDHDVWKHAPSEVLHHQIKSSGHKWTSLIFQKETGFTLVSESTSWSPRSWLISCCGLVIGMNHFCLSVTFLSAQTRSEAWWLSEEDFQYPPVPFTCKERLDWEINRRSLYRKKELSQKAKLWINDQSTFSSSPLVQSSRWWPKEWDREYKRLKWGEAWGTGWGARGTAAACPYREGSAISVLASQVFWACPTRRSQS